MTAGEFDLPFELLPEHQGDPDEFINFGDVSRFYLRKQAQYGSLYVDGWEERGYPNLGEGLAFEGDPADYHALTIKRGDVPTFVTRYLEYRRATLGES